MHGSIHKEFKGYVVDKFSETSYDNILQRAGFRGKEYDASSYYEDREMFAIVSAAEDELGMSSQDVLYEYGVWVTPGLLSMHQERMLPEWTTLNFLEATEAVMHRFVIDAAGAKPPVLRTQRTSNGNLIMYYESQRKMCTLGVGFIKGVSMYYGQHADVEQLTCMHRGDERCTILVSIVENANLQA